jgi:hypothetical protein
MNGHDLGNAIAGQIAALILIAAFVGFIFGGVATVIVWWLS